MSVTRRHWSDRIPEPLVSNQKLVFVESVVSILLVWAIVAHAFGLVDRISSPTLVSMAVYELFATGEWYEHTVLTLRRVLYGFVLTLIVGTGLGIATGMSDFWEKALQDYVTVGLAFPSLFAAVFAAMWFGRSDVTPMVAAAAIAFPFLTQEVYEAVKNIDGDLLEMASSFEVSRRSAIRNVIVPSILPQWFGGARYSFAISWKIVTLAELVAASNGIGYMIQRAMDRVALTDVLAWTAMFTILMLLLEYGVLRQLEKRLFEWRQEASIGWG